MLTTDRDRDQHKLLCKDEKGIVLVDPFSGVAQKFIDVPFENIYCGYNTLLQYMSPEGRLRVVTVANKYDQTQEDCDRMLVEFELVV